METNILVKTDKLTNEEFQETTAKAIFNGMEKFINDNK